MPSRSTGDRLTAACQSRVVLDGFPLDDGKHEYLRAQASSLLLATGRCRDQFGRRCRHARQPWGKHRNLIATDDALRSGIFENKPIIPQVEIRKRITKIAKNRRRLRDLGNSCFWGKFSTIRFNVDEFSIPCAAGGWTTILERASHCSQPIQIKERRCSLALRPSDQCTDAGHESDRYHSLTIRHRYRANWETKYLHECIVEEIVFRI